jgi:hypothetical protein
VQTGAAVSDFARALEAECFELGDAIARLRRAPQGAVVHVQPAREVRIPLAAAALGLSQKAIRGKIQEGVWLEGHQYFRRNGEIWISLEGVSRWVRGDQAAG